MTDALTALAFILCSSALLFIALHYGERWVDRMLHYSPLDPSKPIVRKLPE